MRFNYVRLLPVLILMMSFCANVMSIKCYQCRSDLHSECEDKVNKRYLRDCENQASTASFCRTMTQDLFLPSRHLHVTVRECATIHEGERCYKGRWHNAKVASCDCRRDGCNRGAKRREVHRVIVFGFLFIYLIFPP